MPFALLVTIYTALRCCARQRDAATVTLSDALRCLLLMPRCSTMRFALKISRRAHDVYAAAAQRSAAPEMMRLLPCQQVVRERRLATSRELVNEKRIGIPNCHGHV